MHRKWLPSINDDRLTGYRSLQEILRESTSLLRLLAFAFQWITLVNVARWFSYREKVTVWRLGLLCSLERFLPCYIFLTLLVSSQFERNTKMVLPIRMISGFSFSSFKILFLKYRHKTGKYSMIVASLMTCSRKEVEILLEQNG